MREELLTIIQDSDRIFITEIDEKYYSDHLNRTKVRPAAVVIPKTTEEVSQLMKYANANSIPVIPRGKGTGLTGATVPLEGSLVIDLTELNQIEELDKETFTLTVQSGVTLQEVQAFAEENGLFYPPDPGEKTATIGGNISTNAGGMRAVKYGVTRDYIRGLEVVLANGDILNLGGKTIKNSSGLDIKDLIIGSEGTLAIVTKALLKVIPKTQYTTSCLVPFNTLEEGIDTVLKIMAAHTDITAIEFIEKEAISLSESYLGLTFPDHKGNAYLLFTFDGATKEGIQSNYKKVRNICYENKALDFIILEDPESLSVTWQIRGAIVDAVEAKSQEEPIDIVVPINKSAEFVKYTKEVAKDYDIEIQSFGHAGDGNVHLCIVRGTLDEEEWEDQLDKVLKKIYKKAHQLKGLPSGEHGIGLTKRKYFLQYADPKEIVLMKGLKKAFDPKGILNPHKAF